MKNRNRKKNLEERIAQLAALAYRVTQRGKHHVFISYSGHVNKFEVEVFLGGWKSGLSANYAWHLWINTDKKQFRTLAEIRAKLNKLLKEPGR